MTNGPIDGSCRRGRSLTERAVEAISARIRDRRYPPGERLPTEPELMADLAISRTVLREALARLKAAGRVRTVHGVGSFVTSPHSGFFPQIAGVATVADILAVLELRASLETEAAGLAAQRRNMTHLDLMQEAVRAFETCVDRGESAVEEDFRIHCLVANATGNRYFEDILRHLGTATIPRTRLNVAALAGESRTEYLRMSNREHHGIIEAIGRGDVAAARDAMRQHLTSSRERLRQAYEGAGDNFP